MKSQHSRILPDSPGVFFTIAWWILVLANGLALAGCSKPGASGSNFTNSIVRITAINENLPFQSDVLTYGYAMDDVISVALKCDFRAPDGDPTAPAGPSVFDTITFHSYHVGHRRSDRGPNPADFTGGLSASLAPNSEITVNLVIVRAFDKNRSPLEELRDDGEIFTTTTITLYGQDGYGNDMAVSGSIAVSFANFPDFS